MAVMITGGTGFLGSYLTRHLVKEKGIKGKDLVLFERYPNLERIEEVLDDVTLVRGDITEAAEVMGAIRAHNVTQVYHLAALLGGEVRASQVSSYVRVMVDGTLNVFEASRIMEVKRVVYASSVSAFYNVHWRGMKPGEALEDDDPTSPGGRLYAVCKVFSENLAEAFTRHYGLETVGLRPTSVYGLGREVRGSMASGLMEEPGQAHYMFLPEYAALGRPIEMPPDDFESDWIYAADAAEAWYCAMNTPKPPRLVYNMAAERHRMAEVTAILRRLMPDAKISVSKKPLTTMAHDMKFDNLRNELNFRPRYTLEAGLVDYLNRVRKRAGLPPLKA